LVDAGTVLSTGLLSAVITLGVGFVGFRIYLSRVKAQVPNMIDAYLGQLIASFKEKPQETMAQFAPITDAAVHGIFRSQAFKIELNHLVEQMVPKAMEGASVKLPIVGKVPVELIDRFLGGGISRGVQRSVQDAAYKIIPVD
jgi:hypothetical protein